MTNYHSDDFLLGRNHIKHNQLNNISESTYLIQAESLEISAEIAKSSRKSVICALTIIATLIAGSTWQLYYSLQAIPVNSHITRMKEISRAIVIKEKQNQIKINQIKKNAEILAIKNEIANGKF